MTLDIKEDDGDMNMGINLIIDQEFTIAVGDTMREITEFLKAKDYNVFITIAALEMIKQNLITETVKHVRRK